MKDDVVLAILVFGLGSIVGLCAGMVIVERKHETKRTEIRLKCVDMVEIPLGSCSKLFNNSGDTK